MEYIINCKGPCETCIKRFDCKIHEQALNESVSSSRTSGSPTASRADSVEATASQLAPVLRPEVVAALVRRVRKLEREVFGTASQRHAIKPPKSCGMKTYKGFRYWHPECMGGAVYGDKDHCTCLAGL